MNKGFGIIEFAVLTLIAGSLISGAVTVEKADKGVNVQVHKEALKKGVASYKTNESVGD
jgi:hypothetical protein